MIKRKPTAPWYVEFEDNELPVDQHFCVSCNCLVTRIKHSSSRHPGRCPDCGGRLVDPPHTLNHLKSRFRLLGYTDLEEEDEDE